MAWVDFFVCLYLGFYGVHKFRIKKIGMGILYLCTAGLFGIGWLVDVVRYFIAAIKGNRIGQQHTEKRIDEFDMEMHICKKCGQHLSDVENYCPNCGTAKTPANEMPVYRSVWFWIVIVITLGYIIAAVIPKPVSNNESQVETYSTNQEEVIPNSEEGTAIVSNNDNISWKDGFSEELVLEIEQAFVEIGENPEYIISVEYVKDRETDLFIRRDYKVTFDKGEFSDLFDWDKKKWNHAVEWRITTEEWNEGEPEREQYPREYLVTIKFWTDDESTNILQWSHTGNGKLQIGN